MAPRWVRRLLAVTVIGGAAFAAWSMRRGGGPAPSEHTRDDRPNFLVIMPDTLRGDRIGASRGGSAVTPHIDALAARGTRFSQMYSQSGWTLPALANFLSGRWPLTPEASAGQALDFIRTDKMVLAELLTAAGYNTAVFWGPGISEAATEFSRGFVHIGREEGTQFEAGVLAWLTASDRRPFFAVVHNSDLQFPVVPVATEPLLSPPPAHGTQGMEAAFAELSGKAGPERAAQAIAVAYDATVTRYDAAIGRMVDGLEAAGLDDDTVVIVTSNHGIDLGEHGHYFHGTTYDTNLHVPLVIADPAAVDGSVIDTVVQTLDLAPTVFARAGVEIPPDLPGRSLLPLLGLSDGAYTERPVFSVCSASSKSVRTRAYKVARVAPKGGSAETERTQAFDLRSDPRELSELMGPLPPDAAALQDDLGAWWSERTTEAAAAQPGRRDDTALKAKLQEEGYWGVVTGRETGTGGKPAPVAADKSPATAPAPVGSGPVGPPGNYPPPPGQPTARPPPPTTGQPNAGLAPTGAGK